MPETKQRKPVRRGQAIYAHVAVATRGTGPVITTSAGSNGSVASAIPLHLHRNHSEPPTEIVCRHYEIIGDGMIGRCIYCRQERLFKLGKAEIIKRGHIGGTLTMIQPPPLAKVPTIRNNC